MAAPYNCQALSGTGHELPRSLPEAVTSAPSLPGDAAARLLDEVEELRRNRRDLAVELDALAEHVRQLRARVNGPEDPWSGTS